MSGAARADVAAEDRASRAGVWNACALAARDIKLSHSVFALPFAVLGAFLARATGEPWARFVGQLALVVACMVLARTWAMLFNRLVDARIDARNPRTAARAVASGRLAARSGWVLALVAAGLFILACGGFLLWFANPWPLMLCLPVLAWLAFYSLAKRFTSMCHVLLGTALALSPIAAGVAVRPEAALSRSHVLIACFVAVWVAGFDVLYALADEAFDRREGLHSIPAALGPRGAAWVARLFHLGGAACLLAVAMGVRSGCDPRFGVLMMVAWALAAALLVTEHVVLVRRGLAGLPVAFFTVNGVLSVLVGVLGVVDIVGG